MFHAWFSISAAILFVYLLFTAVMVAGWHLLRLKKIQSGERKKPVSLLIPFRNEESRIGTLVESLKTIDYPLEQLEIILINDHSDDSSQALLQSMVSSIPFQTRLISLEHGKEGKREALRAGTLMASHEILAFTDADCRLHPRWIMAMVAWLDDRTRMVCGPVFPEPQGSLAGRLQSLEMASVMAVTAGMAMWKHPVMANGANFFTYREDFSDYLNTQNPPSVSGDDMWYLLFMKKKVRGSVLFSLSHPSAVYTDACSTLAELIRQRKRWAAKSRFYRDPLLLFTTLLIVMMNVTIPAGILLSAWDHRILYGLFILMLSKGMADFALVAGPLSFSRKEKLFVLIPLLEIIYPFYTLILGISMMKKSYRWKGREIPV